MTPEPLTGSRVVLRGAQPADQAARQEHGWHKEIEDKYGSDTPSRPMTDGEAAQWFAQRAERAADLTRCEWLIEADGELVGVVNLHTIDRSNHSARLSIGLYHPRFLGQGFGSEAIRIVLAHAFSTMGLHRVDLRVLAYNKPAIATYTRCGFVAEGRLRENALVDGVWHDDIIMSILANEFAALSE